MWRQKTLCNLPQERKLCVGCYISSKVLIYLRSRRRIKCLHLKWDHCIVIHVSFYNNNLTRVIALFYRITIPIPSSFLKRIFPIYAYPKGIKFRYNMTAIFFSFHFRFTNFMPKNNHIYDDKFSHDYFLRR